MGILDEDVTRVRDATDLVALASEHLALKRVGSRMVGLCPFHAEKSPSFSINPDLNLFHCFGCQASGDAITFVRDVEHLDFVDAVERLAARAGITLRYDDKAVAKDRTKKQRLSEAVAAAIAFYHALLLESADGGLARRYLRSRGFDGDAARQFQLGWSPDEWDHLSVHLQRQKFARDDIVDAGLAFVNKVNKLQDQFRARLMFPIYDSRGEAAGFGGRALGTDGPKYKNSPETPIYQKSRLLYGLNWAKGEIVGRGEVVICEGYTDVMAFVLAGAPNAVATCGTALADDHFQILKNLARKVVLAYDSDAAGQGAAEKWYGWEQRYEIQLQVADLPAGRDPADVWQAAIVAQHPSDLVRDQYVMKLAGSLDIDADRLRETVARRRREGATARPAPGPGPSSSQPSPARRNEAPAVHVDRRELDVLLYAVHEPELVVDWIDARLFVDPIARAAFEAIASTDDFHVALSESDGQVRALLERLAVEEPIASDEPETLRAHLMSNTIGPAADRVLKEMLRAHDDRATSVNLLLDALAHAREIGDWDAVQARSIELLGWIGEGTRGAPSAWREAP